MHACMGGLQETQSSLWKPAQTKCRGRNSPECLSSSEVINEDTEQRIKTKQSKHTFKRMKEVRQNNVRFRNQTKCYEFKNPGTVSHFVPRNFIQSPSIPQGHLELQLKCSAWQYQSEYPAHQNIARTCYKHTHVYVHAHLVLLSFHFARHNSSQDYVLVDAGLNIILAVWEESKNNFIPGLQVVRKVTCQSFGKPEFTSIRAQRTALCHKVIYRGQNLSVLHVIFRKVKQKE